MGQDMPFAHAVVRKGITRCDIVMNGVGIVACTGYFCQDRTFKEYDSELAMPISLLNILGQLAPREK